MIFAAWDFVQYKRQKGRYGENPLDASLHISFREEVPEYVIRQLNVGDMILTQRLDNWLSWAIMHFTKSPFDHMAMYAGDGKVAHMTLEGGKQHSLRTLAKGARVVIFRLGHERHKWLKEYQHDKQKIDVSGAFTKHLHPKAHFALGALWIASGRYPDMFQIRIAVDTILILLAFEMILGLTMGLHFGAALLILYLVLLALNLSKFAYRRMVGKVHPIISQPSMSFRWLMKSGGLMFTTLGPIVVCDLGLVPLKVILRLTRQSTDYGTDHKLKEAGEFFSHLVEGWDLKPETKESENDDCDKKQNE